MIRFNCFARMVLAAPLAALLAACGNDPAPRTDNPTATETAVKRAAGVVNDLGKARPFPADVPAFVQPMPGGSYITGMRGKNALRTTGMDMYSASGTGAEVIAFYTENMTKAGFVPVIGPAAKVRNAVETLIEGEHADGRTFDVTVIEKSPTDVIVQMRYIIPVGQ